MSTKRATNFETSVRAMVLLSGGVDSAVALYWSLARGWHVWTVEFEYYRRPARERRSCAALREHGGIRDSIVVPLEFVREAGDVLPAEICNPRLSHAPEGYIPARNLIFYSICAYYAEIRSARYIVGGHTRTDAESFADAGASFFDALNLILQTALWTHQHTGTEVILPLLQLDKPGVLRLGTELGVPWELTWSCYGDADVPCGFCESCTERRKAFECAGLDDPLGRMPQP